MIIMSTRYVLPTTSKLIFAPIGDIHHNAPGFDRERFVDSIQWLRETSEKTNRKVIVPLMGDELELLSGSERRSTPKCKQFKPVKPKKIETEFACLNCGILSRRKGGKYCSAKCATLVVWRVQKHVRRARKRGVEHEVIDLPTLLDRDRFKCGICAKAISLKHRYPHPLSPSIDHIIPLSRGGSHTWKNVQASHHACNQEKRTQTMGQLRIC